jgi:putative PIN family toxin of toxin-antitoxin system
MRIVLDTNVLVSGLLSPYGPSAEVVRMTVEKVPVCYDIRIFHEYREVFSRKKFSFDSHSVKDILDHIRTEGYLVNADPLHGSLPDPDNEPFLEVALTGRAECLVTWNVKHFPEKLCQGMRILTPDAFLGFYRHMKSRR